MTGVRELGPLGRRLLAAFVVVALSSVAVLTAAALVGTSRGLQAARQQDRAVAAGEVAAVVAAAYRAAGGWAGADLGAAQGMALAAGAQLIVLDVAGTPVSGTAMPGPGMGERGRGTGAGGVQGGGGTGMGMAGQGGTVTAPVVSDGATVGSARLAFGQDASSAARGIAWSWLGVAAAVALFVALAASWFVSGRVAAPLRAVTLVARRFAAGDRAARSGLDAPGELGEVSRALDRMADEVVAADGRRRRMTADVAHELRTPLAALQAGLEELRDGYVAAEPARLAALHDQALRLGRTVADLADLAAAESAGSSLRHAAVDLGELVTQALAARSPQLASAGLDVVSQVSAGVVVEGDADRLHQVLGNLLSNTARYARPGDRVSVTVEAEEASAVLRVADTGPGIAPEDLPHVFDRLWRGRSASDVPGSGIGLAVVRELVGAHGGTVEASSDGRTGTTMTVRLPRAGDAAR